MCLHSAVFCLFAAGYLVWPALFQVITVEWRLAMPRPTQSSPGSTHFTYIILFVSDILSAQVVNHDFAVLFCTSIACLSIQREPSSVAPPEVYSIFYSPIKKVFFSYYGMFFLTWIKGLMREDDVHYTDYHRFVIFGYMNEMDLIWFDLRDLRKKKKQLSTVTQPLRGLWYFLHCWDCCICIVLATCTSEKYVSNIMLSKQCTWVRKHYFQHHAV